MVANTGSSAATAVLVVVAVLSVGVGALAAGPTTGDAADGGVAAQETTTVANESEAVTIQNFSAPSEVQVGTEYTVASELVNPGDSGVVRQVTYRIEGNVIASALVELPADSTERVVFNVTENDTSAFPTGTFTHGVYTRDSNVTANLTLVSADETPTPTETTPGATTTPETTPEAETTTAPETTLEAEITPAPETTPEAETIVETTTPEAETTVTPETIPEAETTTAPETTPEAETTTVETTTPEAETTPAPETTPEAETASVTFRNQSSTGETVTVESVTVPEGGFVVVHDTGVIEGNVVESIVGRSNYLAAGTSENITVELEEPLDESQRLVAIVYRDSNDNREYDFVTSNRTADGPYTKEDSREAVNEIAFVELEDGTGNETATTTA